ncbi:MAG: MBL fold metallo-hydrolase [Halioglobus sp.]
MKFASLGSGSKGNATLVSAGGTLVMVDCGFSLRETTRRLQRLGVEPEQLDAILVTHEHSDHSSGVAALSRKFEIPIFLTWGTRSTGRLDGGHSYQCFNCEDVLDIGDLRVKAVAVPHDAAEPCQYRLQWGGRTLGILTDLGSITPHVVENYRACQGLVLEFNHDLPMLWDGPYPQHLKHRVGGDWGHLNNAQAAQFLTEIDCAGLHHLVVAHVSEQNNSRSNAEEALAAALGCLDKVVFADQRAGFDWLEIT